MNDFDDEQSFQALLGRYHEPVAHEPPPALAQVLRQRLPQVTPADAARAAQQALLRRWVLRSMVLVLLLLLLALGSWSVFVDSTLPSRLLAGSVGRLVLALVLLAKPLLAVLTDAGPALLGWLVLLVGAIVSWERLLRLDPAYLRGRRQ